MTDDQHHSWSVDLDPYSNSAIDSVRVSVQKETVSGWSTTTSLTYSADTHSDTVKITEDGVDFGGSTWGLGQPTTPGGVDWRHRRTARHAASSPARSTSTTPRASARG